MSPFIVMEKTTKLFCHCQIPAFKYNLFENKIAYELYKHLTMYFGYIWKENNVLAIVGCLQGILETLKEEEEETEQWQFYMKPTLANYQIMN